MSATTTEMRSPNGGGGGTIKRTMPVTIEDLD